MIRAITHTFIAHAPNGDISTSALNLTSPSRSSAPISHKTRELRRFANIRGRCRLKMAQNKGFYAQNRGRGGAILTSSEFVLTFGGYYLCVSFGENRLRNATVRVHRQAQTQTGFYSAAALLAIAERCISHGNSVCPSVRHTLVLYPDE